MRAHARLRVELDRHGRARARRLRSDGAIVLRPTREPLPGWAARWSVPCHEVAAVRVAAGAAGPVGGDHWRLDVEVGAGATLLLGAVSATLALPGPHGRESTSEVHIAVEPGATLIWSPGTQIAAARCRHRAVSRIDLAEGARLYAREDVVLGRTGELPGDFRQRLRVTQRGRALYDQEIAVGPSVPGWGGPAVMGGRRALGSIVVVEAVPRDRLDTAAVSVDYPDTAVMRLSGHATLITSLAADTIELGERLGTGFGAYLQHDALSLSTHA